MHFLRSFSATKKSCYLGYITQAVTINFAPLLFLTFEKEFGIGLSQISLLIALNFAVQLTVDALSAKFLPKLRLRTALLLSQIFATAGLCGLALLPQLLPSPFAGLLLCVLFCGIGGGLCEVLISPVIEGCPSENKASSMSLLHSFYCWGQAGVILVSVLFFATVGIAHWRVLACLLALEPLLCGLLFAVVPLPDLESEGGGATLCALFGKKIFWLLIVMMTAAGASEMVMSQWASGFAESGLGVSKTVGDLLGPCLFAVLMGSARLISSLFAKRLPVALVMPLSCALCVCSYLLAALAPSPIVALLGCALCGFSVGVFWPGTYSLAASALPGGGVSMFALLALAGDVGCLLGPSVAGRVADLNNGDLRVSFLLATVLPVALALCTFVLFPLLKKEARANIQNSIDQ